MKSFRELYVWSASVELAVRTVSLADTLCARKRFALADQMQRAAFSVPSNIAEGFGRLSRKEWRQYLAQARGSLFELETQFEIAKRISAIADDTVERTLIAKIGAGLTRMIRKLTNDHMTP
jgi:four helix bundle protein